MVHHCDYDYADTEEDWDVAAADEEYDAFDTPTSAPRDLSSFIQHALYQHTTGSTETDTHHEVLDEVLEQLDGRSLEDFQEVLDWLESSSDASGWTYADDSLSTCDSEFELVAAPTEAAPKQSQLPAQGPKASRSDDRPKPEARRAAAAQQWESEAARNREAERKRDELRQLLRKRFNTVIGRSRSLADVEALLRIKQRQKQKRCQASVRAQAGMQRLAAQRWGRAEKGIAAC